MMHGATMNSNLKRLRAINTDTNFVFQVKVIESCKLSEGHSKLTELLASVSEHLVKSAHL